MCRENSFHTIRFSTDINGYPSGLCITVYLNRKALEKGRQVCEIEFRTEEYMEDCNIKDDVEKFHLYLDGEEIEFITEDIKAYSSIEHCSYFGWAGKRSRVHMSGALQTYWQDNFGQAQKKLGMRSVFLIRPVQKLRRILPMNTATAEAAG